MMTPGERLKLESVQDELKRAHRRIDELEKRSKEKPVRLDPPTKCNSQSNYYLVALGNQCWHLCGILRLGEIDSSEADLLEAVGNHNVSEACKAQKNLNLTRGALEDRAVLLVQALAFLRTYSYCKFVVANQDDFLKLAVESCAHYHWLLDDLPYFN